MESSLTEVRLKSSTQPKPEPLPNPTLVICGPVEPQGSGPSTVLPSILNSNVQLAAGVGRVSNTIESVRGPVKTPTLLPLAEPGPRNAWAWLFVPD